jgi:hypothetical protein
MEQLGAVMEQLGAGWSIMEHFGAAWSTWSSYGTLAFASNLLCSFSKPVLKCRICC